MPEERLTPRERWEAVLTGEVPDRCPTDYWATGEMTRRMLEFLGLASTEEMFRRLHIDAPVTVQPAYVGPPIPEDKDMYGIGYRWVDYGTGRYREAVEHPLARYESVDEIEANYTWPTADWFDYSVIPAQVEGKDHRPVRGGGSEPFLIYKNLRGQEQALMDLVLNPDIVHYCLDKLFDFCYQNTLRIYEAIPGRVLISYVAEDLGAQNGLMMSKEHIRRFLFPGMKRMIDLAHSAGVYVFHHDDGAIREIIPDLIELGIDALNPLQWRCAGMEREGLVRDFGDQLVFHGGVDNQYTLPFGTVEEVKKEVEENLRIFGGLDTPASSLRSRPGGYILAPCHNIQPITPPQNVLAMYEHAFEVGWYE